jgi:hypothetical protein
MTTNDRDAAPLPLTLCPGFTGHVSVRKADHHHNLAVPVDPAVELSQVLKSHLIFHFGRLSENPFHLRFGHSVVNPLVVLPRHFRLERQCGRCMHRHDQNKHDEQSKTRKYLHPIQPFMHEKLTALLELEAALRIFNQRLSFSNPGSTAFY